MKKILIVLFVLFSVSVNAAIDSGSGIVPGVYIVKKKSASFTLKTGANVSFLSSQKADSSKYVRIKIDESNKDQVLTELNANPLVDIVAPQMFYKTHVPNDSGYSNQWYLPSPNGIGADITWENYSSGNGVVIAVIDTGVDYNHVDLKANVWKNSGELQWNGVDDDGNGYIDDYIGYDFVDMSGYIFSGDNPEEDYNTKDADPMDVFGHGTHVAGIAAAPINNSVGIVGVAHEAKIMCLRAGFSYGGNGSLENGAIAEAIDYAVDNGADIINMSFGSYSTDGIISTAIANASANGVVLVASAGNDNTSIKSYPAAYPGVIGVGANDATKLPASFTNYNASPNYYVDISAPGVNIYSTLPGNSYAAWQGTSMSAPVISGVAALLMSAGTTLNKTEVETYLITTANTDAYVAAAGYIGSGIVNSYKVLNAHGAVAIPVTTNTTTGPSGLLHAAFAPNPVDLKEHSVATFYMSSDTDISSWTMKIYNSRGRKIRSLNGGAVIIGVTYDCKDEDGFLLPSGVYYVIVEINDVLGRNQVVKKKLVIVN